MKKGKLVDSKVKRKETGLSGKDRLGNVLFFVSVAAVYALVLLKAAALDREEQNSAGSDE